MARRSALVFLCTIFAAYGTLHAQQPPAATAQAAAQQQALEKLAYMEGTWEGEGWMDLGGGRRGVFRGNEVISRRLNGTVLFVEGNFFARIGEWLEIGERSADGKTWEKVFEMTLRKR